MGGAIEIVGGSEPEREALAAALSVGPDEEDTRAHVHGFHSYPARLHPATARGLVRALAPSAGSVVLDPFCGSGTVVVEARLAGHFAIGTDVNPLAIELARLKASGSTGDLRTRIDRAAERVAEAADDRRLAKAGATKRYGPEDVALYEPHVLLELDGLRTSISDEPEAACRRAMLLGLSSILVKVSRQPGETSYARGERRVAGGFVVRLFRAKMRELCHRLAELEASLPPSAPAPRLAIDDARELASVRDASVDLIVTSPPYPGNYDYLEHHETRLRWLGLPSATLERDEIGARRALDHLPFAEATRAWQADYRGVLSAFARVLRPTGVAAVVIADTVVSRRAMRADEITRSLAPRVGLGVVAIASQERPHFHRATQDAFADRPRREHVVLLRPARRRLATSAPR